MATVNRSARAQQDLEAILDYLDAQNPETVDRFALKFDQMCNLYAAHPHIGASAEAYATNLRHFTVWNYAIFYRPIPEGIEIIRIIHGARDLPNLFE
ncbi:MAG: hypothetical protein ABS79_05725 [Planctomycetes bacterium SCN 63-9]|nr:MAG: hypothetical protein ABS79_05725 [Planctomycetes bacterium SCN 63-9]